MVTKLDEAISELTVIYTKIGKANQEISKRMQSRKFDTYSRNVGILLTKVGNLLGKLKNGKLSAPGELRLIREIITNLDVFSAEKLSNPGKYQDITTLVNEAKIQLDTTLSNINALK
jgi:hypothetical protein